MNREITSNLWPLSGDVSTQAGSILVTVTGLQNIPVEKVVMSGGEELFYNITTNQWEPSIESVLFVNSRPMGDDPYMSVNVAKIAHVNGT
jgi:hypothetical protein